MSTSSENLIHFVIRCHRENILVLQLNLADSEKNIIRYYALRGRNWTFHVECDVSSINRRRVPYHTRLKSNFDRLLYIIFFITPIHNVRFFSVNGEASRVKTSKKKFWEKVGKKFWKKILDISFDKTNFGKINYKTRIFLTKIYSNIDKCHTIFALLALFGKTERKTGSNGLWAVGNSLTTWPVSASSVVRNISSGLAPTIKRRAFNTTRKSTVV